MWNPFRRKQAEKPFPEPEWPPIQELDSIDITGKRLDGGVDLVIVGSQPIDNSPETLDSIRQKVQTYLTVIVMDEFQDEMGRLPREKITIVIACKHPIHPDALIVIEECRASAAKQRIRLELRTTMG
jgi:hypothetical protein